MHLLIYSNNLRLIVQKLKLLIQSSGFMKRIRPKSSVINHQSVFKLSQSIIKEKSDLSKTNQTQPSGLIKTNPHSTPAKTYRINEQQVYNYVRNSVCETFRQKTSRSYDLVKQLTQELVPEQKLQIDRLCKKYSILRVNKRNFFDDVEVNIEEITNRYVKSRSKQKQKEQEKERLRKDIYINYRYGRDKQYQKSEQFFSFDGNDLKDLENRHKIKERSKERKKKNANQTVPLHPYIQLYKQAQKEVLNSIVNNNKLDVKADYIHIQDQQQWQKNAHNLQKRLNIFKGSKRRSVQSARGNPKIPKPDFYLS